MRTSWRAIAVGIPVFFILLASGCSESVGPQSTQGPGGTASSSALTGVLAALSLDQAQLSVAGVTSEATRAVFSVGWKQFVGPDISETDTIGEAYAVARPETSVTTLHVTGLDMGSVTLSYEGGSVELRKHIAPDSGVVYGAFGRGLHENPILPQGIPFVPKGVYTFTVSGSNAYSAGAFEVTAPPSLLYITDYHDGDTVSATSDLTFHWTGGSSSDSVLVRIVPHLRPGEEGFRHGMDSLGCRGDATEGSRPMGHRHGHFMFGGPLEGMGPEFERGIVMMVPNTGSYTLSSTDLATLLSGTTAARLMIGVTQVVKQEFTHDGGTTTLLLRNGDRLVLLVR